jgi:hypothetical protein
MIFSRFTSKNDPKKNAGHATVPASSSLDANNGPADAKQKDDEAKLTVQTQDSSHAVNPVTSKDKDKQQGTKSSSHSTLNSGASSDKSGSDAMLNEGGHATPGKTPNVIRDMHKSVS